MPYGHFLASCLFLLVVSPAAFHASCAVISGLRLRGGGYAYQAPGRRPYVERHTPGQVDSRDVPHHVAYEISPDFDVDKEPWYTGTVEDPKAFWGPAGAPPLPEEVVLLPLIHQRIDLPYLHRQTYLLHNY